MKHQSFPKIVVAIVIVSVTLAAKCFAGEKVLHSFKNLPAKWPSAGLVSDAAGNLYGTTRFGGCNDGCGVVFEMERKAGGGWIYHILHVFKSPTDGSEPNGGVILDAGGNLYGTTVSGGGTTACYAGCGTVFELSPVSGGRWTENVIYRFQGGTDGQAPEAALTFDQSGNLYGTTLLGGPSRCGSGCGTVFELSPASGGGWSETILHAFNIDDGENPWAGVIFDAKGNLYGTTENGGSFYAGVVFELSPSGGTWNQKVLHNFNGSDGGVPTGKLTFDSAGNLYSTTEGGGDFGWGTVFELTPASGEWNENVLHTFSGGSDGAGPIPGVVFDASGNLYGVAELGGAASSGVLFKLSRKAGNWTEKVLHSFTASDGASPSGDLIWDGAGNLYGTTSYGGTRQDGVVFKFTP